jgi:hypothetical protein
MATPLSPIGSASPEALLDRLAASGLRGRGGARGLAHALAEAVSAHVAGGSCPWPERRHPDPFAPGSPERSAVETAAEEQL